MKYESIYIIHLYFYYFNYYNKNEFVNRLVDSLLWEKRERKSRRGVKPKQRKDVVVVFSGIYATIQEVSLCVALGNRRG